MLTGSCAGSDKPLKTNHWDQNLHPSEKKPGEPFPILSSRPRGPGNFHLLDQAAKAKLRLSRQRNACFRMAFQAAEPGDFRGNDRPQGKTGRQRRRKAREDRTSHEHSSLLYAQLVEFVSHARRFQRSLPNPPYSLSPATKYFQLLRPPPLRTRFQAFCGRFYHSTQHLASGLAKSLPDLSMPAVNLQGMPRVFSFRVAPLLLPRTQNQGEYRKGRRDAHFLM